MNNRHEYPQFNYIRSSVLHVIFRHFEQKLGDICLILEQNNIGSSVIDDPDMLVPLHAYLTIFDQLAAWARDPILGARIGFEMQPAHLAPTGLLAVQYGTMERALYAIMRFSSALQSGTNIFVAQDSAYLTLSYQITAPMHTPLRQDAEFSLALMCALLRKAFNMRWRPVEIHFCHKAPLPAIVQSLTNLFGAPVLFEQTGNRILIDLQEARRVYRREDAALIHIIEQHILNIVDKTKPAQSIKEQVESLISMQLGSGEATLESIARQMQMTPRSLQRKLADEGTDFSQVITNARYTKAKLLLRDKTNRVETIAAQLGYADGTCFWRAFRKWSGMSPQQFRLSADNG